MESYRHELYALQPSDDDETRSIWFHTLGRMLTAAVISSDEELPDSCAYFQALHY